LQQPDRNFEPCVPVPEGSKFRSGIAFTRFWKGASNRGPLATGQLQRILVGRTHPIRSRWLRIGAPFGWIDFRAMHNNGQCFKCALISRRNFQKNLCLGYLAKTSGNESAPLQYGRGEFEPCVARPEGSKFRSGVARNRKIRNFQAQKNRFSRKTFKSIITFFRRQRPNAFLTDRWHRGFEFFAHRPCPATQGSTFRARSARRVREKVKRAKS